MIWPWRNAPLFQELLEQVVILLVKVDVTRVVVLGGLSCLELVFQGVGQPRVIGLESLHEPYEGVGAAVGQKLEQQFRLVFFVIL